MNRRDHEALTRQIREKVHAKIEAGADLQQTLDELILSIEQATPSGLIASILVLDQEGKRLLMGAGPSLADDYNEAIHGIEIGPEVGSCGTAAYHDRTVSVFDIENNPLWANFKDLALAHGLRACWSTPIHGSDGRVLGTFANYYRVVRDPSPRDSELTAMVTELAAEAIEKARSEGRI